MPTNGTSPILDCFTAMLLTATLTFASGCDTIYEAAKEADEDLQEFFGTSEATASEGSGTQTAASEALETKATEPTEATEEARSGNESSSIAALKQSADLGDPQALYQMGENYATGTGVEQDLDKAVFYYGEAAVRGYAPAQYELAEAFANGTGVEKNIAWAMRWYGRAAYQGHADAQFAYGVLMATGRGLPENPGEAYRWLLLAERQGHPDAREPREALENRLSPSQTALEKDWVQLFKPQPSTALSDPPTVLFVQYQLGLFGYNAGPVDGLMGPQTVTAIEAYSGDHGLGPRSSISETLLIRASGSLVMAPCTMPR